MSDDGHSGRHDGHYTSMGVEPMHFFLANDLDAAQSAIIKYVSRHKHKGQSRRDLEAARDLLIDYIEFLDTGLWKGKALLSPGELSFTNAMKEALDGTS